jgi:hypothetical protein
MKKYMLIFMLLIACGCNRVAVMESNLIQHSYLKNYSLGELKTAHIGQPIVKAKDFYEAFKVSYNMKSSSDFELRGIYQKKLSDYNVKVQGKKDINYPSSGSIIIDGIEYTIINMKNEASRDKDEIGILVDKHGNLFRNSILDDNHDSRMKLISSDNPQDNITFVKGSINQRFDEHLIRLLGCYINYELIYGGINNVSLSMTYREFTIDDMARPSFFQNIVYETKAKQIRFKDTVLDVIEATNEKIVYKVISDGLIESTFEKNNPPKDHTDCLSAYEVRNKKSQRK